jgi:DNA (cytosine-5)-methyltransferase 1
MTGKVKRMGDLRLTVLDLFSGAGGMALGFEAAGGRCVGAVEIDEAAAGTFRATFANEGAVVLGGVDDGDMAICSAGEILGGLAKPPDIIVGGPPCQGFSRIGRAKRRSLLGVDDRVKYNGEDQDRSLLYRQFLRVVAAARPVAFVIENVHAIRDAPGGIDMAARIARESADLGYNVRYFLLNAAWYGVPQQRWRIFFVGLRRDLGSGAIPRPPKRTHTFGPNLPEGCSAPEDPWMIAGAQIPEIESPRPAVTVREAIGDLPRHTGHLKNQTPEECRLPTRGVPSPGVAILRDWPGRPAPDTLSGNWYRSTPRDYDTFRDMAHGDVYPQAVAIASCHAWRDMLTEPTDASVIDAGSARPRRIPPYRVDAFDEKWGKLVPDQPSWTVTAHLSKDGYSHIHYDSTQARTITIREAARLQSFPDAVEFKGSFGAQLRQIGNAVPPLLARAVAQGVMAQLQELSVGCRRPRASRRAAQ